MFEFVGAQSQGFEVLMYRVQGGPFNGGCAKPQAKHPQHSHGGGKGNVFTAFNAKNSVAANARQFRQGLGCHFSALGAGLQALGANQGGQVELVLENFFVQFVFLNTKLSLSVALISASNNDDSISVKPSYSARFLF